MKKNTSMLCGEREASFYQLGVLIFDKLRSLSAHPVVVHKCRHNAYLRSPLTAQLLIVHD